MVLSRAEAKLGKFDKLVSSLSRLLDRATEALAALSDKCLGFLKNLVRKLVPASEDSVAGRELQTIAQKRPPPRLR